MKYLRCILALSLLLAASLSLAGNEHGGGGLVVCRTKKGEIKSRQLLDFFELGTLPPYRAVDMGPDPSVDGKVRYVLNRLQNLDAVKAQIYEDAYAIFFQNIVWESDLKDPSTNDFGYFLLDEHCSIEQFAIQERLSALKVIYRIDWHHWVRASNLVRAGLILHEIVYGNARSMGHKTSVGARKFTGLIASADFGVFGSSEYNHSVWELGLANDQQPEQMPPIWGFYPMAVAALTAGDYYERSLKDYVFQVANEPLHFEIEGPSWLKVSDRGVLYGTVPKGFGLSSQNAALPLVGNTFKITAIMENGLSASADFRFFLSEGDLQFKPTTDEFVIVPQTKSISIESIR